MEFPNRFVSSDDCLEEINPFIPELWSDDIIRAYRNEVASAIARKLDEEFLSLAGVSGGTSGS